MTFPLGKRDSMWMANSGAMRDAIADADGRKVGDQCSIFGVVWRWTGVTWVEEGGGAAGGIYINVKTHGMVAGGDGDTNTTALQAAIDAAAGFASWATVIFPAAASDWNCNGQVQLKTGVRLLGEGAGKSVLSFAGGTGSFTHDGALWGEGSAAQIEAFNADADEGDRSITLASPPSAVIDDLVLLYDPTDSSWDTHTVHQRSGEFLVVEAISTNDIDTVGSLLDSYLVADAPEVHKVTPVRCTIEGLTVIGRGVHTEAAISFDFGRELEFVRCHVTNDLGHGIWLSRCYRTMLDHCNLRRTGDAIDYALLLHHCQDVEVDHCNVDSNSTFAPGIRLSDSATEKTGAFPCRKVVVDGGVHRARDRTIELGTHSDLCTVRDVDCNSEIYLAGGRHVVSQARVRDIRCINTGDFHYPSFTIEGCEFIQRAGTSVSVIDIDLVGTDEEVDSGENAIIVRNNKVTMVDANTQHGIEVTLNTEIGPRRLELSGNKFSWASGTGGDYAIDIQTGALYGTGQVVKLEEVVIEDNALFEGGIFLSMDVPNIWLKGNTVKEASDHAFFFALPSNDRADTHTVHVRGNDVQACTKNVVHFTGFNTTMPKLYVVGNVVDEWGSGTAQEKVPVWADTADSVAIRGNVFAGGPGTDFAVFHIDTVVHLDYGGNSYPEIGASDIIAPTVVPLDGEVTTFSGPTSFVTESLLDFSGTDRFVCWGTAETSQVGNRKIDNLRFDREVFVARVQLKTQATLDNVQPQIYLDDVLAWTGASETVLTASEHYIDSPMLFVPKGTDIAVLWNKDASAAIDTFSTAGFIDV